MNEMGNRLRHFIDDNKSEENWNRMMAADRWLAGLGLDETSLAQGK